MFITSFFRSCRGYVRFKCEGEQISSFLTEAAKQDYKIWTMKRINQKLYAYTYAKQYKEVAQLARKTKNKTQVLSRKGLFFFVSKYKKRVGLGIGILIFLFFLMFMQNFVWSIEIVGNETIQTEKIMGIAENYGLKIGAYKSNLDIDSIIVSMKLDLGNVAWLSINDKGSDITIELKEMTDQGEVKDANAPCNITAKKDGRVVYMNVERGNTVIQLDDYVTAGDLLVSGIYEDIHGNSIYTHSQAEIIAQTEIEETFHIKKNQEEQIHTGNEKTRRKFNLGGLKIPLYIPFEPYDEYSSKTVYTPFKVFGFTLPFGYYETLCMEYVTEEQTFSEKEAKEKLDFAIDEFEQTLQESITVVIKDVNYSEQKDEYIVQVFFLCEENIAQEEEILMLD